MVFAKGGRPSIVGGMTLAELVVALGLFAMISVVLTTLFLGLLTSANKGNDMSEGDIFAQKRLQIMVDRGFSRFSPPLSAPLEGSYRLETADKALTEYFYTATSKLLDDGGGPTRVATYLITLEVNWSSKDVSGRPLAGETKTRVQRVVHIDPP